MKCETLESELTRLRGEQSKTREDEVFGGLSLAERAAYNTKDHRIHELESKLSERTHAEFGNRIPAGDR
jgi:hypothetical protein